VRDDAVYDRYASICQAKSTLAKVIYLVLYLLPGILAYVLLFIGPVFRAQLHLTGLSPRNLQYAWLLIVAVGWHMFVPFFFLRRIDKLSLRQSFEFLGLNRIDWRGLLLVLPVYCAAFALVSLLYMTFLWPPLFHWLQAVPAFRPPSYSIFQGPDVPGGNLYSFSPFALAFLFIGNFLGEELYFRGYLMKKTAFLGRANWIVNSLLFGMYHLWQVPPTWASIGLILAFGLLMSLRKDLWVLVVFHLFVNMWLTFGEYPVAHLIGLR
jgi:hypothetical protein